MRIRYKVILMATTCDKCKRNINNSNPGIYGFDYCAECAFKAKAMLAKWNLDK